MAIKKNKSSDELKTASSISSSPLPVIRKNSVSLTSLALNQESSKADNIPKKTKKDKRVTVKSIENLTTQSRKSNTNLAAEAISLKSSTTTASNAASGFLSYSYVVLFGSFIAYMLASLLSSCFGVFFENMESDLGWSKSKVAFIGGLISALQDLSGPISSALTNEYGCRKTAVFGGLIAALGMIGSAYVNDFWSLGFLMGAVSGFGSSLVLVSSVVVVTYYFEQKPSFAAGLVISGGSLGQSIFSLIIIKLNEIYGRSGCFLILGGILLNIVVCAFLFRPLQWELEDEEEDEDDEDEEDDESSSSDDDEDDEEESSEEDGRSLSTSSSGSSYASSKTKPLELLNLNSRPAPVARIESMIDASRNTLNKQGDDDDDQISNQIVPSEFFFNNFDDNNNNNTDRRKISPNSSLASTISLKSVEEMLYNLNDGDADTDLIDEHRLIVLTTRPKKMLRSYAETTTAATGSLTSLSRCHSLDLKSYNNKLKSASNSKSNLRLMMNATNSVPTDLKSFNCYHSIGELDHAHLKKSSLNQETENLLSESDGQLLNNYDQNHEVNNADENAIEINQQYGLDNNEYVIVDADEIDNANIILSSSQNAIYLPVGDDSTNQEKNIKNDENNNNLSHRNFKNDQEKKFNQNDTNTKNISIKSSSPSSSEASTSPLTPNDSPSLTAKNNSDAQSTPLLNQSKKNKKLSKKPSLIASILNKFRKTNSQSEKPTLNSGRLVQNSVPNNMLSLNNPTSTINTNPNQIQLVQLKNQQNISNNNSAINNAQNNLGQVPLTTKTKKYYIAKCSCKQQQKMQNISSFKKAKQQSQDSQNSSAPNIVVTGQTNINNNNNNNSSQKQKFRHYPTCPLFYLNFNPNRKVCALNNSTTNKQQNSHTFTTASSLFQPGQLVQHKKQLNNFTNLPILNPQQQRLAGLPHIYQHNPHHHNHHHNHHHQRPHVYKVSSLFQNSYKVPLHFRNVYYYKSLLNLNMRLMVIRPHGAGALTIIHKPDPSAVTSNTNNMSLSCPDLQPKQVLVINKKNNENYSQNATNQTSGMLLNNQNNALQGVCNNNNNQNNQKVFYPVLTLKELKFLKQQANQYRENVKKLNSNPNQIYHHHHHHHHSRELKSFSGAQVLNVGSILLRPNPSMSVGGAGSRTGSSSLYRKTQKSIPAIILPTTSTSVNQQHEPPQLLSDLPKPQIKTIQINETNKLRDNEELKKLLKTKLNLDQKRGSSGAKKKNRKKKKNYNDDSISASSLSGYNDKIIENVFEDEEEDEDDDSDESDDEDDESESESDEDDEEEDCDNCITRTKIGNLLYKYAYKPIVRPIKFICYSTAENIKLFRVFKFCLFALCNFILSFFYEAPFYFINSYMIDSGSTANQAGTITVAVGIVSVFSSSLSYFLIFCFLRMNLFIFVFILKLFMVI
jgi:hypothetical protein